MEKSLEECNISFLYQVTDGKLFVLVDRRETSIDSRSSAILCIGYDQMVGLMLFRIWESKNK